MKKRYKSIGLLGKILIHNNRHYTPYYLVEQGQIFWELEEKSFNIGNYYIYGSLIFSNGIEENSYIKYFFHDKTKALKKLLKERIEKELTMHGKCKCYEKY